MDFQISDEQKELLELVREFVQREVTPRSAALDRQVDPADCFSWELLEKASELGLRTLTLAPEFGGSGIDTLTTAMVIEELAKGDLGFAVVLAQMYKLTQSLQRAMTPGQAERYLPRLREDPRFLLAIASTEPDNGGSNNILPYRGVRYRTRAERTEGGWILNGGKHFISNGNRASLYLVFAQTDPDVDHVEGSTCFLLPRETEGFSIGVVHNKMGERLVNNAELIFDSCFIPEEDRLSEPGKGFELRKRFFSASNAYAAASVLGVAQAAYEKCLQWTSQRVTGGQPLIRHPGTREDLAEMRMLLDTARTYIWRAAWAADHQEGWDPVFSSLPKVAASRAAWRIVTKAMELHGGYGFMKETGMERLVRDAAAFLHSDGVNRILLLKAADAIDPSSRVPAAGVGGGR